MPTLPIEPITTASASLTHAWRESGMKSGEAWDESEGANTGRNFLGRGFAVKPYGAILGMQMQCNKISIT
jgi:hypothetical protein